MSFYFNYLNRSCFYTKVFILYYKIIIFLSPKNLIKIAYKNNN